VAIVHPGATLTPHFRDFLPSWVARQPWYPGPDIPSLTPVGYLRLEDPAGAVGIETHLVSDKSRVWQVPMTYRGAALDGAGAALITTAEHSVLGTRWIYDGPAVRTNASTGPSAQGRAAPAEARGRLLVSPEALTASAAAIEVSRVLMPGAQPADSAALGLVTGTWHPAGPGTPQAAGLLAVIHRAG
jgi:hypothetical protein